MTNVSIKEHLDGSIVIWTDNKEIREEILRYIDCVFDAIRWRNHVEVYRKERREITNDHQQEKI